MKRTTALTSLLAAAAMVGATLSTAVEAQSRTPGAGPGAMMGNMGGAFDFAEADADGDGKVTQEELRAWRAARAAALDADGDGRISEDELVAAAMAAAETRARMRAQRMIARFDTDGDGALSAAELLAGGQMLATMFDRIDRDNDGAITEAELAQARERMMKRHDRAQGDHRSEYRAERRAERRGDGPHRHRGWDKRGDRTERRVGPGAAPDAAQD
ncbi:MAG: EF-hand domain-containing protein [Pseudorhodobacter sp.]